MPYADRKFIPKSLAELLKIDRNILRRNGTGANGGSIANAHTCRNERLIADPPIVSDDKISPLVFRALAACSLLPG